MSHIAGSGHRPAGAAMAALAPPNGPQVLCSNALRWIPAESAAISQRLAGLAWLAAYPGDCGYDALRARAAPAGDGGLRSVNAVSPVESLR